MMQNMYFTPLFVIFTGTVLIALIALTMRSVVRRDKAMINPRMDGAHEAAAYKERWRDAA